jgi:hypothetical protein
MHGFPLSAHVSALIAPASQVGARVADPSGAQELVLVDLDGRALAFRPDASLVQPAPAANPLRALLAWPPTELVMQDGASRGLLLVVRDFRPIVNSRSALDLVGRDGRSMVGFPVDLPADPGLHHPVVDNRTGRVFVLLETGAVDGIDAWRGTRLDGFPTAPIAVPVRPGTRRMALFAPWDALLVSTGGHSLVRIAAAGGKASEIPIAQAVKLTGLDAGQDRIYCVDEGASRLLRLDSQGRVSGALDLKTPPSRNYDFRVLPLSKEGSYYVVLLSVPDTDPNSKVGPLFEQYATPADRQELKDGVNRLALLRYHTLDLSPAQRRELDSSVIRLQRSYLQNALGMAKAAELIAVEKETRAQVVLDADGRMQLALDDTVKDFTPDTHYGPSDTIFPATYIDLPNGVLHLAVPLNSAARAGVGAGKTRAMVRLYHLPY